MHLDIWDEAASSSLTYMTGMSNPMDGANAKVKTSMQERDR